MFGKLVKMQMMQNCGLYIGACASAIMGMLLLGKVLTQYPPIPPFEYAPGIFFLTTAALVLTKILYDLMNRSFREPESALMMTLPVSEETHVQSRLYVGTLAVSLLYLFLGVVVLYWGALGDGMDVQLTALASMYVDLTYPAWVAALSVGLLPLLVVTEQLFFSGLMLLTTLVLRGRSGLQKWTGPAYLVIMVLQIGFNMWLLVNYETFIGRIHPLVIAGVLEIGFGAAAMWLYRVCIRHLKYQYQD